MVHEFLIACALLLIFEGIWPFLHPASLRTAMLAFANESDELFRLIGLASMIGGLALLYLVN